LTKSELIFLFFFVFRRSQLTVSCTPTGMFVVTFVALLAAAAAHAQQCE
jgi:hypothetical protein